MNIAIIDYPGALKSAVFGLSEMFLLANQLASEAVTEERFSVDILTINELGTRLSTRKKYTAVFLPPSIDHESSSQPTTVLTDWLIQRYKEGSMLCSACAGLFIIAPTGVLEGKEVTTHWQLADDFSERYPTVNLNVDKIVINDGDIITAGGMMAWLDLGLELISQLISPKVMRQLGKLLVVDTGLREQRYYQQFTPKFTHGDELILRIQRKLAVSLTESIKVAELAESFNLTERTFFRRFIKSTGIKPSEYIQRLRIQKACDLLEDTTRSFELIANDVGYEDTSACRKTFKHIIGLTPREFRNRF